MNQIFCQNCGTSNNVGARYCSACGAPFASSPPPAPVPPQYAQPQPVYQQPPIQNVIYQQGPVIQKKKRGILSKLLSALVLLGVCCLAAGFAYYWIMLRPIQGSASDFLNALKDQDYTSAYLLCSRDIQTELGSSPSGLKSFVEGQGLVIRAWKFTKIERIAGDPPKGIMTTNVTLQGDREVKFSVHMVVEKPANVWKVMGFGID